MIKHQKTSKLSLRKETLVNLDAQQLARAGGGDWTTIMSSPQVWTTIVSTPQVWTTIVSGPSK